MGRGKCTRVYPGADGFTTGGGGSSMKAIRNQGRPLTRSEISAGLQVLVGYFIRVMRSPSSTHRYEHTFACGGKAFIEYTQFRRAALVTLGWPRSCGCQIEADKARCDQELIKWMECVDSREEKHFKFRR